MKPTIPQIDISQVISDNVLGKEEIVKFIHSNFPCDIENLSSVVVIGNYFDLGEVEKYVKDSRLVQNQRRPTYLKSIGGDKVNLIIATNEGQDKIDQFELQINFLNKLKKTNIDMKLIKLRSDNEYWEKIERQINRQIGQDYNSNLSAITVGGVFNFHFYLAKTLNSKFWKDRITNSTREKVKRYIDYRLNLVVAEEEHILGNIDWYDPSVFSGSNISKEKYETLEGYAKSIKDLDVRKSTYEKDNDLIDYLIADYLFFSDKSSEKEVYKKVSKYNECKRYNSGYIGYQIMSLPLGNVIGFDWIPRTQTERFINLIRKSYNIRHVFYYGKCGYLGEDRKLGDIIYPMKFKYGSYEIERKNPLLKDVRNKTNILCIISQLLETKKEFVSEYKKSYDSIDMESYAVAKATKELDLFSCFYISDFPLKEHKLSVKLDQIIPRLKSSRIVFNELRSQYF